MHEQVRASTSGLLGGLDGLDEVAVRAPSLLPGWTRGHVLTHLARNADSHVRMLDGALREEVLDQYEGGAGPRAAAIEAGAHRSAADLMDDVRASAVRLDDAWNRMTPEAWEREVRPSRGTRQASILPSARRREVEVHRVDLGFGYVPDDWPADFVEVELGQACRGLPDRLPDRAAVTVRATDLDRSWSVGQGAAVAMVGSAAQLLAWLIGRGGHVEVEDGRLPELGPWA